MTSWYKDRGAPLPWVAFSVRPDIWPAGSCCRARMTCGQYLADWGGPARPPHPDDANGVPGAAEALILAGQVVQERSLGVAWTEIADPRAKGAA